MWVIDSKCIKLLQGFFDNDLEITKKMKKMCNSFIKVKYTNLEQVSIT